MFRSNWIRGLMGEMGLLGEDWNDRHNWSKKKIHILGRRKM
jgi:hypothetical protein